jgi:glycosyltransferase involved in cell wall biosynthesis
MNNKKYKLGILVTHPIQYYVPWYQALSNHPDIDLTVYYCYQQTAEGQANAGFGVTFNWDIPLLERYNHQFLKNVSKNPNVFDFWGCDTPEIFEIIKNDHFDAFIVHGWYAKSYGQAILACWQNNTPVLIRGDSQLLTPRSKLKQWLKYGFYRWFIPKFSAYLAVGKRAKDYYLYYGADESKIFFAPHAVNNQFFAENKQKWQPHRSELRQQWEIPENALVFLFVGKVISKKRPEDFINAIALSSQKHPEIYGVIVGDGEKRNFLENWAKNDHIPIRFLGFMNQTEIPKSYAIADVLVLPSDGGETWGLVVNEAMASGLPAIVSDQVGCGDDLVRSGETGEIFACGDVNKLAAIMEKLAMNREEVIKMGKNSVKLIDKYAINCAVDGTIAAIKNIVKKYG